MPRTAVVVSDHCRTRGTRSATQMQTATERIDGSSEPRNRHERRAKAKDRRDEARDGLAYTVNRLAEKSDTGRSKIYAEIRAGRLKAKKLGSRTLITAQAADDWLSQLPDFQAA